MGLSREKVVCGAVCPSGNFPGAPGDGVAGYVSLPHFSRRTFGAGRRSRPTFPLLPPFRARKIPTFRPSRRNLIPPPSRLSKRRRQTAPARGPSAVYAFCRRNRNETKHPSPLLVGLGCVNTPPTALAADTVGTAGSARTRSRVQTLENPFLGSGVCFPRLPSQKPPQADGPCSWAVRRVRALPPDRNETKHPSPLLVGLGCVNTPPTALAADTVGTAGSARTRSRVQTLENPFLGSGVCFPRLPSQKPPQADGPCSWAVRRVCALPLEQKRNEASPPPAHGADLRDQRAEGTGRRHCRLTCRRRSWRRWRR